MFLTRNLILPLPTLPTQLSASPSCGEKKKLLSALLPLYFGHFHVQIFCDIWNTVVSFLFFLFPTHKISVICNVLLTLTIEAPSTSQNIRVECYIILRTFSLESTLIFVRWLGISDHFLIADLNISSLESRQSITVWEQTGRVEERWWESQCVKI